ncbi:MAG: hypothetical protein A2W11_04800 [Ignavibacteria bacterium RBG_16_35_7]|nr:MAG: hypothetical protein A2W11_04800 [Ignavibacteria bacterium RBG_16_35_7]
MKNFIFIPAILFGAFLTLSGCYTYLSLSNDAKLADVPYEPYYPPEPAPPPDPGPPGCPEPGPRPIIIIYNPPPPSDPYQRPKEISDIRNEGEGRNSDTSRRRR